MSKFLRIGIDVRLLTYRRGIGNYVYNLLHELIKLDAQNEYFLYGNSKKAAAFIPDSPRCKLRVIGPALYPIWEQFVLPFYVKRDQIDVLHCPANAGPLWLNRKTRLILTIHDIMYMLPGSVLNSSPSLYQNIGRKYLKLIVPLVAKKCAAVITVSHFSRSDIIKYLSVYKRKVHVIYEAAGPDFYPISQPARLNAIEGFELANRFILSFGAIDPRKNTARVIEAFSIFIKKYKTAHHLVITGLSAVQKQFFLKKLVDLDIDAKVVLLGFVSEKELTALYNAAELLLYPSLYEGFGFPILEAMACGAPVITSVAASIPEIAGDAAILIDPTDVNAMVEAIHSLSNDEPLREKLKIRGLNRAAGFSWAMAASETLSVYKKYGSTDKMPADDYVAG